MINQFEWLQPTFLLSLGKKVLFPIVMLANFCFFFSIILGAWITEPDVQQGEYFKMIYLHVPFAWQCMILYALLSCISFLYVLTKHPILFQMTKSFSFSGFLITFCCLFTGSLWGLPTWGTFWVWDARLTSVLILFFIYSIHLLLCFYTNPKTSCYFALMGLVNLPIIKYSVEWWSTLHQGASINQSVNLIHESILIPMLLCWISLILYSLVLLLIHLRIYILNSRTKMLQSLEKKDD